MSANRRPVSVLVIGCIYMAVGCIGLAFHFHSLRQPDAIWVMVVESLAIVAGAFLLLGQNWARWLAIAWMGFHVVISYGDAGKLIAHSCFLVLIAWLLFRRDARRYFRGTTDPL